MQNITSFWWTCLPDLLLGLCPQTPLPSHRHHWSNGDCLESNRGKLSGLFCAILCATIVHSAMHTHMNRPNSSLEWVLSHWANFTVLRFIFVYVLLLACRGFRAQRFYLKKSKFFRKRVFVFCKFYFVILSMLYIDFYTIRIVFASSFQLCILKVANFKKIWQFWQKCVDRTFVHVKHGAV